MSFLQASWRGVRLTMVAAALVLSGQAMAQQPSQAALKTAAEITRLTGANELFAPLIPGVIEQARLFFVQQDPTMTNDATEIEARLGVRVRERAARLQIAHVLEDGSGWRAGLSAGDELVALDGYRAGSTARLAAALRRKPGGAGAGAEVTVFRRDELRTVPVVLGAAAEGKPRIERELEASDAQVAVREGWLRRAPTRGGGSRESEGGEGAVA